MSIKKSLLALAAAALVSMAFASMAAASGGTLRDVIAPNNPMPAGTKLHYVGWFKYSSSGLGTFECHVTLETEAISDTTARVLVFTMPDTSKCTGTGIYSCTLTSHSLDGSSPTVTATATDFDVLGFKLLFTYSGCSTTSTTLDFTTDASNFFTLKPLNTTNKRAVTNTAGNLGNTTAAGDPIAGVEFEGKGTLTTEQHIIFTPTHLANQEVLVTGELEITGSNRCTWKLVTS